MWAFVVEKHFRSLSAIILITLALVFYTIGVWSERVQKVLKPWRVALVPDGAEISSSTSAAFAVVNAEDLVVLFSGTNALSSTENGADFNAALYSNADLTLSPRPQSCSGCRQRSPQWRSWVAIAFLLSLTGDSGRLKPLTKESADERLSRDAFR
ncbi:carbohydrate-binding domain-containing protein [Rhodoglobus sp.]